MAYDVLGGFEDERDFSIGLVGPIWEKGKKPSEIKSAKQARALAALIDTEIKNNAAIGVMKKRAGVLDSAEEKKFKNFYVAWHSWLAREMKDDRPPTKKAAAELPRWREKNAEWTQRFSDGGKKKPENLASATSPPGSQKPSRWPMLAAIAAAVGLGAVLAGQERR